MCLKLWRADKSLNRLCLRLEILKLELAMTGELTQALSVDAIDLLAYWTCGELGI